MALADTKTSPQKSSELGSLRLFSSTLIDQRFQFAEQCLSIYKDLFGIEKVNSFIEKLNKKTKIIKIENFKTD